MTLLNLQCGEDDCFLLIRFLLCWPEHRTIDLFTKTPKNECIKAKPIVKMLLIMAQLSTYINVNRNIGIE